MIIDIIFLLLLVFSVIKGFRNGFVVAVFSFLGIFIGLAAAMKFSTLVAEWLKTSTSVATSILPFLSFALVMVGVIILVRLGAKLIQTALEMVFMGWINKLAGIVLYFGLYTLTFSVVLFYAGKIHLFTDATIQASRSYAFLQPLGPKAIEAFGTVLPLFKGMFADLSAFFENSRKGLG